MNIKFTTTAVDTAATSSARNTVFADCGGSPKMDLRSNTFVFDHHCEGRMALHSAAGQVYLAILQGLTTSAIENVVVNHTDADSVLAVWLLQHPERVRGDSSLWAGLIEPLSRIDNHGPAAALPGEKFLSVHYLLAPERGEQDGEQIFLNRLERAEARYKVGSLLDAAEDRPLVPGRAFVFAPDGATVQVDNPTFDDIYAAGGMGVLFGEGGTVTIGKLPFFPCRSFKQGLIGRLNAYEDGCGWGGADSIMGSPRPGGSKLTEFVILGVIQSFLRNGND
jgi:hypothetical protein